jgi:hypothetical protein
MPKRRLSAGSIDYDDTSGPGPVVEKELTQFEGYRGLRPVRIGNDADPSAASGSAGSAQPPTPARCVLVVSAGREALGLASTSLRACR